MIKSITYKDWFLNQKRVPDKQSKEYEEFYDFHKTLCLNGFNMGGVYFNPFLYWHLNFWHTEVDYVDDMGRINQKYANPTFRDNEWIISNTVEKANKERKGVCIFGARRISKSVFEASYIGWGATFDESSQNVISGLNAPDIKLITDKLDKGLTFLPDAWKWQRIEDNWKNQVTLGIKKRDGTRIPFSYIMIRNLDDGNNQEAIAGTKPRKLIIDEGGKGPYLKGLQAAIPGFTTPYGWGCSPIVSGTGGDFSAFRDAKILMFDGDSYNFLTFIDLTRSQRRHGLFLGNKYRMEAKEDSNLSSYLEVENKELEKVHIQVSNEEKADKILDHDLESLRKSGDRSAYLKEKMYYPKKVDDIFLNEETNIYNVGAAKAQQIRIKENDWVGFPVELFHDGDKITHRLSDKQIITEFPVKSQSKDAPACIWEFPIENPPFGLYCAGVDPYRFGKSEYSDSLGAVYIYKRMHDIASEKFQNMFVASYVARPDDHRAWEEQARFLIKYYNCRTLCENDELSFINYMISMGDGHYLEDQPQWLKDIVPNTTVNRDKGIHRSAEKIRDYLHGCLKKYMDEELRVDKDENGSVIATHTGVIRIPDTMLLEEIINFSSNGNYDREVAATLALALANHLDPILGKVGSTEKDKRFESYFNIYNKKKKHLATLNTPFSYNKVNSVF